MTKDLILPVYLNQRVVFDLLAMLEGGIAHITKVDAAQKIEIHDDRQYGSKFGLGKALASLLSIDVSASRTMGQDKGEESRRTEERIHTPTSLFYRLRERLFDEGLVKTVGPKYGPCVSDLVEFRAFLVRNPLTHAMDSMIALTRMMKLFSEDQEAQKGKAGSKNKKSEFEKTLDQMILFNEHLKSGGTSDVLAENVPGSFQALITLETEYLNDPTMADLVDGQFWVLGKVIKTVLPEDSISLIRKSALTVMPKKMLEHVFSALQALSVDQGFNLPLIRQEVSGPAFHVLPVAIYT